MNEELDIEIELSVLAAIDHVFKTYTQHFVLIFVFALHFPIGTLAHRNFHLF